MAPDTTLEERREQLLAEITAARKEREALRRRIAGIDKPLNESERKQKLVDERRELHREVSEAQKRLDEIDEKIAKRDKISAEEAGTKRACLDGATTWLGLQLAMIDMRRNGGWTGVLNAADRTPEHVRDCGEKCSQEDLFLKRPGCCCNPANPPGQGSHEGVNGGSPAFRDQFAFGAKLPWWAWGLDVSQPEQFQAAAAKCGYRVFRPYPHEPWHWNFFENPLKRLRQRGLIG